MKCKELLGYLSDYIDGDLADDLCLLIERHAQHCQPCRIMIHTLQTTVTLYHRCKCPEVPRDVHQRLVGFLHAAWKDEDF
jgi:predicted anti-sigma-YlaC factor YlaD